MATVEGVFGDLYKQELGKNVGSHEVNSAFEVG